MPILKMSQELLACRYFDPEGCGDHAPYSVPYLPPGTILELAGNGDECFLLTAVPGIRSDLLIVAKTLGQAENYLAAFGKNYKKVYWIEHSPAPKE